MTPTTLLNSHGILKSFLENVAASGTRGISQIIVFGSIAKNAATAASDIDILILLKPDDSATREVIRRAAYRAMDEANFARILSLHFMEESRFIELAKAGYSFENSIVSEGVKLWKAA